MNFYKKSGILQTALFVEKWNIRGIFMKKLTILFFMIAAISFFEVSGSGLRQVLAERRQGLSNAQLDAETDKRQGQILPWTGLAIGYSCLCYVQHRNIPIFWNGLFNDILCKIFAMQFVGGLGAFGGLGFTVYDFYALEQEKKRREFCKFLETSREMPSSNLRKS
mgnify:CR=1 FL=1